MTLRIRAFLYGLAEKDDGVAVQFLGGVWFIVLEASGKLVGVLEDVVYRAGHMDHLRYFSRTGMA